MKRLSNLLIFFLLFSSFITPIDDENINDTPKRNIAKFDKNNGEKIFIENKGQWDNQVLFRAKLRLGDIYIKKNGISFVQLDRSSFEKDGHYHGDGIIKGVRVDFDFVNSNVSSSKIYPQSKSKFTHNFIDTSGKTITAYGYSVVYIHNMYDGIDWRIYTTIYGGIKHEFILKPNADPSKIKIQPKGHNNIKISEGQLHVDTGYMPIIEKKPETFYSKSNKRIPVKYHIEKDVVTFEFLKNYDKNQSIIIDPELIFSTYSGSVGSNWGYTATYGENGTAYTAGIVFSNDFPVTPGVFQSSFSRGTDIGVLKFSSDGSRLLYATYLGGENFDTPHSLLMDKNNNLIIFGTTASIDFPVTINAYQRTLKRESVDRGFIELRFPFTRSTDLFLSRLSSDGRTLMHSTLIGGTGIDGINTVLTRESDSESIFNNRLSYNYGDSFRGDLAQDSSGNLYVTSTTKSRDFPITLGAFQSTYGGGSSDAIVFKMNEFLSQLIWSTYVGGNYGDNFYNMKLDDDNNIIACGSTISTNSFVPSIGKYKPTFSRDPIVLDNQQNPDGFIAKINALTGNVTSATYVGTRGYDQLYFVDMDSNGDIFTIGVTKSIDYPKSPNTYGNINGGIFIQKLSKDLTTDLLSTRIGSTIPSISPTSFLVNKCDDIYFSGFANKDLSASYRHVSTFYRFNPYVFLRNITFSGTTEGLPISTDAYQKTTDGKDFYLMILNKDAKNFVYGTFFGGKDGINTFDDGRSEPEVGDHVDGGTNRFDKNGVIYHAVCTGCGGRSSFPSTSNAYSTTNKSDKGCNNAIFKFNFSKLKSDFTIRDSNGGSSNTALGCSPYTIDVLNSTKGSTTEYLWDMGDGTNVIKSSKDAFSHTYENAGVYTLKLISKTDNSCLGFSEKSIRITVVESGVKTVKNTTICYNKSFELWATNINNASWRIKEGAIFSRSNRINVTPLFTTTYVLTGNSSNANCSIYKEVIVNVIPDVTANFNYNHESLDIENPSLICSSLPTELVFKNTSMHGESFLWDFGDGNTMSVNNTNDISHTYLNEGTYSVTITANSTIACNSSHTKTKTVTIGKPNVKNEETITICKGNKYALQIDDYVQQIKWYKNKISADNLIAVGNRITVKPEVNSVYYTIGKTPFGCEYLKKTTFIISNNSYLKFRIVPNKTCFLPMSVQLEAYWDFPDGIKTIDTSKEDITFDMGDKNILTGSNIIHSYVNEGSYLITMTAKSSNCDISKTLSVKIPLLKIPNVITPNGDAKNDTFAIQGQNKIRLVIFDRWDNKILDSDDYKNDWPSQNTNYTGVFNYEATIQGGSTCNGWLEIK